MPSLCLSLLNIHGGYKWKVRPLMRSRKPPLVTQYTRHWTSTISVTYIWMKLPAQIKNVLPPLRLPLFWNSGELHNAGTKFSITEHASTMRQLLLHYCQAWSLNKCLQENPYKLSYKPCTVLDLVLTTVPVKVDNGGVFVVYLKTLKL
jgi:hypothetical protein